MNFREWLKTGDPAAVRAAALISQDTTGQIYITLRMMFDEVRAMEARRCALLAHAAMNKPLGTETH